MLPPIDAVRDFLLRARQELRGYHHVLAAGHVLQCPAHELLRRAQLIGNGSVEEIHAEVERLTDNLTCRLLANRPRVLSDTRVAGPVDYALDRKSTRLNSSHD